MRRSMIVGLLACAGVGCDTSPCKPQMVVVESSDDLTALRSEGTLPASDDDGFCIAAPVDGCMLGTVADGDGFVLVHQLPRPQVRSGKLFQVSLDDPLTVTIETPCGTTTRTLEHDDDGVVQASLLVPDGGGCGMTITAEIANDRQSCVTAAGDCSDLDVRCESSDSDETSSSETG